jgi:hypothetical protein
MLGVSRASLALQFAGELEKVIRAERVRYAPATLIRTGIYGLLATVAFVAAVCAVCLPAFYYRDRLIKRFHKPAGRRHRMAPARRKKT